MKVVERIRKVREEVKPFVKRRLAEFERLGREGKTFYDFRPFAELSFEAGLFSELSFCILTANSSALLGLKLQSELGEEGFLNLEEKELEEALRKAGHRWAGQRAKWILEAREKFPAIRELLKKERDARLLRELLSSPSSPYKVKGLGLKEASHFLRNVGFKDVAIVDRHVFRFLLEEGLLPPQKSITKKVYLKAEEALKGLAEELGFSLAELDLYVFYAKTKKVLK